MKYPIVILIAALLTSCSSLMALQEHGADAPTSMDNEIAPSRAGTNLSISGTDFPTVVATPAGGHSIVMAPCGNTSVVVNADGSHSIAIISGATATIVTP